MSRIGVIWVGFNTEEYVEASLRPWIEARRDKLGGHEFVICAVNQPFKGFEVTEIDDTKEALLARMAALQIDNVISYNDDNPVAVTETEARGAALRWLVEQGCEISVMCDSDEFWTTEQIARALSFVATHPHHVWWRVCLRNYVFDDSTYLVEPFTPPRIHRLKVQGTLTAAGFEQDNDIWYGRVDGMPISQRELPSATIPRGSVWVRHLSWPNSPRSRRKIEYQLRARCWPSCTFAWDDSQGGLIFNPALPAPETARDE